jgi:voltage-gated potassium channel
MRLPEIEFTKLIGLSGVSSHETPEAREWGRRLEWPMLLVAIWIPVQWYLVETSLLSAQASHWSDWLVWLFFIFETVLLTALVRNKRHYLVTNWMNLVIILAGFPIVWNNTPLVGALRNLRLLLVLALVMGLSNTLRRFLMRNRFGTTLGIALMVVVLSGILVTRIEPAMGSISDGIWWAWVTVFTVGYGDIAPQTPTGRLFGGLLILFGVGLISLLTANLAAFLIGSEVEKVEQEEHQTDKMLHQIMARLDRLEELVRQQSASPASPDQEAGTHDPRR